MISPIFLVLLLPIAGYVILKSENINIDKKKLVAGFFIILLLAVTPSFSFQPAFADNNIRQIIKIADTYPAGVASFDVTIDPPLLDLTKTFVFYTVSHTGENDASDTFKSVEIVDLDTLRLKGENTASGNNALDFIVYIVEFSSVSTISVQHLQESLAGSAGAQSFTMGSVNTTNSFIINRGHHINASTTAVGNNDYDRIRIATATTWEVNIDTAPTTPEGLAVSVVDWNQDDISVQRGLFTMVNPSFTGVVTPPTAIDPTRTILLTTYTTDGGSTEPVDDAMLRSSLTDGGDIRFSRGDDDSELLVAWELIEFPSTFAKVTHFNSTITGGSFTLDVTVPQTKDFSKSIAISHSGSPFGFSGGQTPNSGGSGAIDRVQSTLKILNNTVVQLSRDDSTNDAIIGWQLIEFFETDVAENAQATNQISQIVKFEGAYTGATASQDFTISPALSDISKSMLFVTISDNAPASAQVAERLKRFFIKDTTTLTISGTAEPTLTNNPINFTATIIEFGGLSPIFQQFDQAQYPTDINSGELIMHMSPVNITGSHIQYNGWTSLSDTDTTIGKEEFARLRILTASEWGYDIEDRNEPTVAVANIIDWNSNDISVQRGQSSLSGTTLTVSPPTDVIRNQTILLVTHIPSNDELNDEPDDAGLLAFLDGSVPPDIIFERTSGVDLPLEINWQLISFPSTFASVQHHRHSQSAGVSNATETITAVGNFSNAFGLGTVQTPIGHANGKGSFAGDDTWGEITGKLTLEDTTTVRFERGLSVGSWELGFQVVEFLVVGGIQTLEIQDVVTAVDLETNMNITKVSSDIASTADTVSTGIIFVVNLSDTGEALDVIAINVTKLAQETVGTGDDPSFIITKLLDDTASISDTVGVVVTLGVEILDTVTANDLVILNVTKTLSDVASTIDNLNLDTTKVFLDTTVIVDQTGTSTATDVDEIDTVTVPDNLVIDVTKLIQDVSTIQDQVVLLKVLDLAINDTVTVDDPSILFIISTVIPNGTGTPPSSGGGVPSGIPSFQRLVGLAITSELFFVATSDRVPSDFIIQTFGREDIPVSIVNIEADQQFASWFEFSSFPDPLLFDTEVDTSRTVNDPARFKNTALDDFVLNIPNISCSELDVFATPVPCIDQIIYEAPITFTFKKGNVEFRERHIVTIDASTPIVCDAICQLVDFITQNYWWLAGILIMFMILYFAGAVIRKKGIRTVRRINERQFTSFSGDKPRVKFKKGKR